MGPRGWGPEGWGPEGWGPERWRARRVGGPKGGKAQNFALFFFPCPAAKFVLFFPLWGSSRGILVVFEAPGRSIVHVWSSWAVVCEPRRPVLVGPPGFHTTAREPKRAHLRGRAFKNTTKIQRKGPTREGEKNKKLWREREKKERNFGRSGGGRSGGEGSGGEALNTPTTHTTTTT